MGAAIGSFKLIGSLYSGLVVNKFFSSSIDFLIRSSTGVDASRKFKGKASFLSILNPAVTPSEEDFNKSTDLSNSSIDSLIGPIDSLIGSFRTSLPLPLNPLLTDSFSEDDEEEPSDSKLTAGVLLFFFPFGLVSVSGSESDSEGESEESKSRIAPSSFASSARAYLCSGAVCTSVQMRSCFCLFGILYFISRYMQPKKAMAAVVWGFNITKLPDPDRCQPK